LVTGASRGIGLAIAQALGGEHDLVLVGRQGASLEQAAQQLRAKGVANVTWRAADLGDVTAVHELADALAGGDRPVQVLVNNAGIASSAPLSATDDALWANALAVNLTAPFVLVRTLAPRMVQAGWGRIVNVASTSALKGYRYTSAYSASKGGLLALTRAVAAELAKSGVTVNAVCPGFTDTDIAADAVRNISEKTGSSQAEARASLERFSPIGRLIAPGEVAGLVAYLCSDAARAITGQALAIDGGETVT
jgi:NAD(P)-dependent dehydrogenase (short-subunit alcohol dehydrogenase family)